MADKKISELTVATPDVLDVIPFVDVSDVSMALTGTNKAFYGSELSKVKYDAGDPASGYISEKIVAGEGIVLSEGTITDENKLKIDVVLQSGGMKSFFFTKTASDVGGMYKATTTLPSGGIQTITGTAIKNTETVIASFITDVATSSYRVIEGSRFFYITGKTDNDHLDVTMRGYIYTTDVNGANPVLLRTSSISDTLIENDVTVLMNSWGTALLIPVTTRIKFVITAINSHNADHDVTISVEDNTYSRLDVPSPVGVTDISGLVPYTGATTDVDLNTKALEFNDGVSVNIPSIKNDPTDMRLWKYTGVSFSVNAQESGPIGIRFNSDGTKLYVIGSSGDDVTQYTLSTPYDISTLVYEKASVTIGDTGPEGIYFSPDGTKMYIGANTNDQVRQFTLNTPWDVGDITFVQALSITAEETTITGVYFKPDGTKMYIIGSGGDEINEYNLGTAWDISTATPFQLFSVAYFTTGPGDFDFNSDGTKVWVVDNVQDEIFELRLSSAWDISTCVLYGGIRVDTEDLSPNGLIVDLSLNKAWMIGSTNDRIYEYKTNSPGLLINADKIYIPNLVECYGDVVVDKRLHVGSSSIFKAGVVMDSTLSVASTFTASSTVTMSTTTGVISIGTSQTTGTITLGATAQTGTIIVGRSTKAQTIDIGVGATENVTIKAINIGTAGVSGSTTNINIGSAVSGATTNVIVNKLTASEIVLTDANKGLVSAAVATYPSLTELSYVKGLSSAVQTQLNGKADSTSTTYVGTTAVALNRASAAQALTGITDISPSVDGTAALQFHKADGSTPVMTIDTTNSIVGIGVVSPLTQTGNVVQIGDNSAGNKYLVFQTNNNDERGIQYYLSDGTTLRGYIKWNGREDLLIKGDTIRFNAGDVDNLLVVAESGRVGIGTSTPLAQLHTTGGRISGITTVTDTYQILVTDSTIVCNKATAFTVTLPTGVVGQIFAIKNINTGPVTVSLAGDTIDGETSQVVGQWDCMRIQCSSTNVWIII